MNQTPAWDHYRSFLAVVEHGSLSGAARALGLTQPTLARHVEQLEAALGARLFTRSPQGLDPTDPAQRLVPHAKTMAAAAAAASRAVDGDAATLTGTVRIAASDVVGALVLPGMLRDLRAVQPGLSFELALSNEASDLLRREADIAIRMMRPEQSALVAKRVGEVMLGAFAHPDYLARHGTPDLPDDLAGHDLIGVDRDLSALRGLDVTGFPLDRASFAYRLDNQIAHIEAIRQGLGIGICQVGLAARAPRLTRLFADRVAIPLETWVTMHEDLRGDARMRVTFDHLCREMAAYCRIA
ncbi:LysR family transcriptional regulator [Psychromarinibacter sp. S121]|uniref:LysR family transcriptional regulator n=1 Tax=Psychromarinibacter sp. S121 TaxID=3415127 RepID=UPI003C7B006D